MVTLRQRRNISGRVLTPVGDSTCRCASQRRSVAVLAGLLVVAVVRVEAIVKKAGEA